VGQPLPELRLPAEKAEKTGSTVNGESLESLGYQICPFLLTKSVNRVKLVVSPSATLPRRLLRIAGHAIGLRSNILAI
jgi:hypothetical protein